MSNDKIKQFERWLVEEEKASTTIVSYVGDVQAFHRFLCEKGNHEVTMTRFTFLKYKESLVGRGYAPSTINKKVNSLKVYHDFLYSRGSLTQRFIELKRDRVQVASGSDHVVTALSEEQIERLLFFIEDGSKVSVRNKLIIYLLLYTGVRVTELVTIKLIDLDRMTGILTVRGKGGKLRELSLRTDVLELVHEYQRSERQESKFSDSSYLFVSQRASKMHRDAVRELLARLSFWVGIHLHPHLFRHTFCTQLLRKGVELTTVSKLAGHSSVNMTAKYYIQTTREDKRKAVELL
ncbi:integrase [Bacillaceae bacterium JMAK1]|nr:integrase [Bacillaceae bacterium JMAK1]